MRGRRTSMGPRLALAAGCGAALGALALAGPAAAISGSDVIRTFAGNGTATASGDGGPATAAGIPGPVGLTAAPDGTLFVPTPGASTIRRIAPDGRISTYAGTGTAGFSGDGGQATAAQLDEAVDVALDGAGNLYIADRGNHRVRRVTPQGVITTIAGTGNNAFSGDGGPATSAELNNPVGVTVDAAGNVYIADELNHRVRRIDGNGVITTFAGTGVAGSTGDGGPAAAAQLDRPIDVRVDGLGNVFVADIGASRVRRISPDGTITTVAGTGVPGFSGDGGPAGAAQINAPIEVVPDAFGNVYISDSANHRVRRVNGAGVISTIVGTGTAGFAGDGGPASEARINTPAGVVLNLAGDLFLADRGNNRIRTVDNPLPPGAIPEGTAQCARVPARPTNTGPKGTVKLSAEQLLINQRISQAAVRRVNAVQQWLDDKLATDDLCGGAMVTQSFDAGITTAANSAARPEALAAAKPRPVAVKKGRTGSAPGVKLEARQLLITQRISQAAVRRANGLTERLDKGLTGGDLRDGAVTLAKISVALRIASAVSTGTVLPPTRTVVAPPQGGNPGKVTISATQILINQRIAQAAVRRSNAL
ncbi:MAG TPA: NHL repeat-containing protein, partial [Miltoncostaea sp.]|nr:NHL repeat-containing protein [Miltoncostaea sp.]